MAGSIGTEQRIPAPWHLWVIGLLALIWSAMGCYDFLMTQVRDPAYLADTPPVILQMIDGFPIWTTLAWGLGVGASLVGTLMLLGRQQLAFYAFALSLLGLAATTFYQWSAGLPDAVHTPVSNAMTLIAWLSTVILVLYSLKMSDRGVLA